MDIKDIQNLIKFVAKSGATEVKLEMEDVKITIRTGETGKPETTYYQPMPAAIPLEQQPIAVGAPVGAVAASGANPSTPKEDESSKYVTIKPPIIEHSIANLHQTNLFLWKLVILLQLVMFFVSLKR